MFNSLIKYRYISITEYNKIKRDETSDQRIGSLKPERPRRQDGEKQHPQISKHANRDFSIKCARRLASIINVDHFNSTLPDFEKNIAQPADIK